MNNVIVLLHGSANGSYSWRRVQSVLASRGSPVFAPDMLDYGEAPAPSDTYSIQEEVAHLQRALDLQGVGTMHLVAHSLGAMMERLRAHERQGHTVLVLVWDPASWHRAHELTAAIPAHNRQVDREGRGVKLVPVTTPVQAFWLNRAEPLIGQAKKKVLPCRQFASPTEQQGSLDRHWLQRNLRYAQVPSPEDLIAVLN